MKKVILYLATFVAAVYALKTFLGFLKEHDVTGEDAPVVKMSRDYISLD